MPTLEELMTEVETGGAPPRSDRRDLSSLMDEVEQGQEPEGPGWLEVVKDVPRAVARGYRDTLEFFADAGEALVKGAAAGAATPTLMNPDPGDPSELIRDVGDLIETDELRERSWRALDPYIGRTVEEGSPLQEGVLAASEAAGGFLGMPAGGVLPNALAIAGTGTGRAAAEAADLGETGTLASEIAGAIGMPTVPGLVRLAREFPALAARVNALVSRRGTDVDIPDAVREQAINDLRAAIAGPDLDQSRVEDVVSRVEGRLAAGDKGSLSVLADDPSVRGVEVSTTAREPVLRAGVRAREQAAAEQARERIAAASPGDELRAREPFLAQAREAEERAVASRQPLEQAGRPEETGTAVKEAIDAAETEARRLETLAWSRVDADAAVPSGDVKQALAGLLGEETTTARKVFEREFAQAIEAIKELPDRVTGVELNDLRRIIAGATDKATLEGVVPADLSARFAKRLSDAIKAQFDDLPDEGALRTALATSRERFQAFGGPLGRTRAQVARSGRDAETGSKVAPRGPGGGQVLEQALGVEKFGPVRGAVVDDLWARFNDATQGADGTFSATKAATWLRSNRAAVREADPALYDEMQAIVDANRRAEPTVGSRFAEYEEGSRAFNKVLNSKTPVADARTLVADARQAGGTALEDLQASAMAEYLKAIDTATGDVSAGAGKLARERQRVLREVLDEEQLARFNDQVDVFRRVRAGQEIDPEVLERMEGISSNPLILAAARLTGAKAVGAITGQPLIAANLSTAAVKEVLERAPRDAYHRMMGRYMLHPEEFVTDMRELSSEIPPERAASIVARMLTRFAPGPLAATAGDSEE